MLPPDPVKGSTPPQGTDAAKYRDVIRHLASGVTIITSSLAGEPVGLTATAVCSVSASPPLLLISLNTASRTAQGVAETGRFAVHLLPHRGRTYAEQFASRSSHFEGVQYTMHSANGIPVLTGVLGFFLCEVEQKTPAADHVVFIGRVLECELTDQVPDPLLYFDRGYRRLAAGVEPGAENLEPWGATAVAGLPGFGW
jgi:3-hydroxy-9,10-secoandrosta-1,3,5(10)-triene-9,17-dione monooxygenase reductase component